MMGLVPLSEDDMSETTEKVNLVSTLHGEMSRKAVSKSQQMLAAHDEFQERLSKAFRLNKGEPQ